MVLRIVQVIKTFTQKIYGLRIVLHIVHQYVAMYLAYVENYSIFTPYQIKCSQISILKLVYTVYF